MSYQVLDSNSTTLTRILVHRATFQPDKLAFAFLSDGESVRDQVSYAELDRRARRVAGQLRQSGVRREPVLLLYQPGLDYVVAFFGCLYAGAIAVPAYPPHRNRSVDRLRGIVADSGARVVLCSEAVRASLDRAVAHAPELQAVRWLVTDARDAVDVQPVADLSANPDDLAFLQYTSGSTSAPKGVMLSHANLLHNLEAIAHGFECREHSVGLFWLPLYHDMGLIGGILEPLYAGCPCYLMAPATFLSQPIRWLQAISRFRGSISGAPNFAYDLCVSRVTPEQVAALDLSSWKVAFSGAEPVHAATLDRFAATFARSGFDPHAFYPCYGLAEATLIVTGGQTSTTPTRVSASRTALEQNRFAVVPGDSPDARLLVSCGPVLLDQRLAIVHPETLSRCPPDQPGEVWASGPSIAQGYWRRPDEREQSFAARTADGDGPFLRTGDVGFLHDGELYITGRMKDLIILRGRNLYPQDIEQTAERSHRAIRSACSAAFAVDHGEAERLVVVAEVERTARDTPAEDIAAAVRQAVGELHEAQVDAVVLLRPGSIPKTSSGKIQRHACKSGYLAGTLDVMGMSELADEPTELLPASVGGERPSDGPNAEAIRTWLVERIAARLRVSVDRVDVREPLARYGLDSLTAVRLAGELEEWLTRPVSPVIVYEYPTIDALARCLAGSGESVDEPSSTQRSQDAANEPVAVVGIGCRFPGANGPDAFWRLLRDGVDAITEVPADRWKVDDYYSEDGATPGTMNTRWGGFLDTVDRFDRSFFGISPREAERMDPQQRLLLEVAWEALEDAGQDADRLAGRPVGVFVGISSNDYGRLQAGAPADLNAYVGTGNAFSIAANRLSYAFDFRGPSLAVDTACSSSLVAVHLACQSLRRGEAEMAIAAGVNVILTPDLTVNFTRAGMMAPDGRCKAFDAAANGYVRSEGVGVVVLKPLARALADGDPVYAIVRGSAVNQDGRSNGLTAPNRQAQEAVLQAAYQDAGVVPGEIDAIEAHGTGTSLGDPIEALALGAVLGEGRPANEPALLGSVKTNIGHVEAAAGVAGFIKMALALKHGAVPPSLHFRDANAHIPFAQLPLQVVTEPTPLPNRGRPARVGVSSFGFGGTNTHVVLEALATAHARKLEPDGEAQFVPLSARTPEALADLAQHWIEFLGPSPTSGIADLAYTATARRTHHDHRLAVVARTRRELAEKLAAYSRGEPLAGTATGRRQANRRPRVAFVFAGQGPQRWGMGRALLSKEPAFRAAVERCDAAFAPLAGWSLIDELSSQHDPALLDNTAHVQPLLFALQVGLAELWQSWGIEPGAVVGHSLGEVAAAFVAGALSLDDAVRVVYHRSRLQSTVSGRGKMAAVGLTAEESKEALRGLEGRLAVAAVNGPRSCVWSGEPAALDEALQRLKDCDVFHRLLKGQVAFHSPQMHTLQADLESALADLVPRPMRLPFYSTVTGTPHPEPLDAAYWGRNLREPVQFAAAANGLIADGFDVFLELGPHPVLAEPLGQCLSAAASAGVVLASLRRTADDRSSLLECLTELYVRGVPIRWDRVQPGGRVVTLPAYPWQRERCWYEASPARVTINGVHRNGYHPALNGNGRNGHRHDTSPADGWLVRPAWVRTDTPDVPARLSGSWLVVADDPVLSRRLPSLLRERGAECVVASSGPTFSAGSPDQFRINPAEPEHWRRLLREAFPADRPALEGVIHLAGLAAGTGDGLSLAALAEAQEYGATGVLHLAQALVATGVTLPRLWVVTRGAEAVDSGDAPAVAQAPLWGLGRALAHELPDLRVTLIDLDPSPSASDGMAILRALTADSHEPQLAWRGADLYAARLRADAHAAADHAPVIRGDATYLVTGGLGSLGLAVARWLVDRGARSLVLTGRRGPGAEAQTVLAGLRQAGANVLVASADVADTDQLVSVLTDVDLDLPPLRGVVHAAGVLDDGVSVQLTRARLLAVLAPKVLGAWNLHTLTAARNLDFFVMFSSAAAVLGSPGQSNYAAANAFLDALAHYRRRRNLPAVSINWGPWADSGMAARGGRDPGLATAGMGSIPVEAGLNLFGRLLIGPAAQVGVLPVEWGNWRQFMPGDRPPALVNELIGAVDPAPSVQTGQPASALDRAPIVTAPRAEWPTILESQLREQAARVLRLPAAALDTEQPLSNLGIDSLMAIELKNRIEADLGVAVPMVRFLEGPSVRDLAGFLADKMDSAESVPAAGIDERAAGALLARIDTLSDDQVDALLQELYAAKKED